MGYAHPKGTKRIVPERSPFVNDLKSLTSLLLRCIL